MPVPPATNITHKRGDSLTIQVAVWNDVTKTDPADLSAATVAAQVREDYDTEVVAAFDVTVVGNVITAVLSPESSRALTPSGVWDLQVDWFSDDSSVTTIAAGGLVTKPDVTRTEVG